MFDIDVCVMDGSECIGEGKFNLPFLPRVGDKIFVIDDWLETFGDTDTFCEWAIVESVSYLKDGSYINIDCRADGIHKED